MKNRGIVYTVSRRTGFPELYDDKCINEIIYAFSRKKDAIACAKDIVDDAILENANIKEGRRTMEIFVSCMSLIDKSIADQDEKETNDLLHRLSICNDEDEREWILQDLSFEYYPSIDWYKRLYE